jgi:cytoskeletal protein CcmA (bactofilin family)
MFTSKQAKPNGRIDTLIGAGSRIEGNIMFSGGLRIDGVVAGNIASEDSGTLVLSEDATVEGEIRVAHAVINGKVTGPVHTSESLELQSKAKVAGDVYYATLEVHLGAIVQGRLVHGPEMRSADKVVPIMSGAAD